MGRGTTSTPGRGGAEAGRVEVRGLTWRPYGRSRPVLDRFDLAIAPGERVLVAGPSGSGKSTLLRAIAGLLLTADSGELAGTVTVDGAAPQDRAGAVGLVLQDPGAGVVASTIGRDVAFGLENVAVPRDEMPVRVRAALAEVGLTMAQDSSPATLSGGESQRLALAGALVMEPRVLLLDEPTAMLDPETAATVRDVVDRVARRHNLTVVVVEHRLEGWLDQVDRLVVLDGAGTVVADGDPRPVLKERGEGLAAQGIWVPGVPDPEPLRIDLPASGGTAGVVPEGEPVVCAEDVTVEHRSRRLGERSRVTVAVRDRSLEVAAGETVALVGPSGSGKSSLMSVTGGLVPPTRGQVRVDERLLPSRSGNAHSRSGNVHSRSGLDQWPSKELARVVAWVPQRAATALVGHTVLDEVLTTPRAIGLDPGAARKRAEVLLEALGLAHLADADPRNLSGGEQRRLAVAAAVAHGPALVLADEPTVGQDRLTWSAVMGVLATAEREGAGVLVTTHDSGVINRAARVVPIAAPGAHPLPSVRGNRRSNAPADYLEPGDSPSVRGNRRSNAPADYLEPGGEREEAERHTLLSRVGPLGLLLAALSVLVLPALLENWRQGLAVLSVEVLLGLLGLLAPGRGRAPTGRVAGVLRRLTPALLAVLGVGWSAWLLGGRDLEVATGAALRVTCLVVPSAFVVGHLDPERLGDHLAQRLHLPARAVVAATAALQRVQAFDVLWAELMTTRRVRGIRADRGPVARLREAGVVTVSLLVGALGQAAVLALAMDARGFAGAHRRTWAGAAPWRLADGLAV
ncbi:ABC transporter ATP-binding protein, partial [Intrasporangium chromatireducens Q5-1]